MGAEKEEKKRGKILTCERGKSQVGRDWHERKEGEGETESKRARASDTSSREL